MLVSWIQLEFVFLLCFVVIVVVVVVVWKLVEAWDYIQSTRDLVRDLENRVRLSKRNVDAMRILMAGWSKAPLYKRRGDKKDSLLNLEVSSCVEVS